MGDARWEAARMWSLDHPVSDGNRVSMPWTASCIGLVSDVIAVICFQAVSVWDGVEAVGRTGKVVGTPS
jgi:hypothetical protein